MLHLGCVALAAAGLSPAGSWAQAGAACHPSGTADERNACVVHAFRTADTALTMAYIDRMASLPVAQRSALRREQNQWLRQRVTHCQAQTQSLQASADWSAHYHQCLLTQIQQRHAAMRAGAHPPSP
jgi:uncharacterized protein YecT (DUF1311 family)